MTKEEMELRKLMIRTLWNNPGGVFMRVWLDKSGTGKIFGDMLIPDKEMTSEEAIAECRRRTAASKERYDRLTDEDQKFIDRLKAYSRKIRSGFTAHDLKMIYGTYQEEPYTACVLMYALGYRRGMEKAAEGKSPASTGGGGSPAR